jgi:hypothetical protein
MSSQVMRLETHLIGLLSIVWTLFLVAFVALGRG